MPSVPARAAVEVEGAEAGECREPCRQRLLDLGVPDGEVVGEVRGDVVLRGSRAPQETPERRESVAGPRASPRVPHLPSRTRRPQRSDSPPCGALGGIRVQTECRDRRSAIQETKSSRKLRHLLRRKPASVQSCWAPDRQQDMAPNNCGRGPETPPSAAAEAPSARSAHNI